MTDRELDLWLTAAAQSAALDDPAAPDERGAACLSMARLAALTDGGSRATSAEHVHLDGCAVCAGRLRAFGEVRAASPSPGVGDVVEVALPVGASAGRARAVSVGQRRRQWLALWTWRAAVAAVAACVVFFASPSWRRPAGTVWLGPPIVMPGETAYCLRGDSNCDGRVDALDISAFVVAMARPEKYGEDYPGCDPLCTSDMNGDGAVTNTDLVELIQCASAD